MEWNSKEYELKSQIGTFSLQCKEEQEEKNCKFSMIFLFLNKEKLSFV